MDSRLYKAIAKDDLKAFNEFIHDNRSHIRSEVTPGGNTALHLAASYGNLQIVQRLLQPINIDTEAGNERSREYVVVQNLQGNTAIHEAAKGGHYEVVNVLLEHNNDMGGNMVNKAGETALFKACEEGHEKIVEKLLRPISFECGHKRTSDGQTPLHCAIFKGHTGVIKILLDQRPDLLLEVDDSGRTPLHSAAYVKKEVSQIAKLLIEREKRLCYIVDRNQQSALHIAVKEGNVDLVKEILDYCYDCIEIVDNDGRNALHLAAENAVQIFGRISRRIKTLVKLLLKPKGLRLINNLDNNGKTALDIVMEKMHNDERLYFGMKKLLEGNGAQMTPKMAEGILKSSSATEKPTWKMQIISVNAVLIATVAFAAAFTLPDPHDHDHDNIYFQVLVICNALAFCSSIASAIILMYALYGNQEDSLLLQTSLAGLWIALIALAIEFGSAMFVFVEPKNPSVAAMVWFMAMIIPITIRIMIFRSKEYIFSEDQHYFWVFVTFVAISFLLGITTRKKLVSAIMTTFGFLLFVAIVNSMKTSPSRRHLISGDDGFSGAVWDTHRGKFVSIAIMTLILGLAWLWFATKKSEDSF